MIGSTNYSGTSLKSNRRWRPEFLLLGLMLLMKMDISMAFFFNKVLDASEFLSLLNDLPQGSISDRQIKRTLLEKQELPDQPLENLYFKSCKWHGVDAHAKTLKNIIFEDCEFNNVNMRGAELINVQFIGSSLTNVVMNKARLERIKFSKSKLLNSDPNILNGYREMKADKLEFNSSQLTGINFFGSKAVLSFNESKLNDVSGVGMLSGSSLYFNKTQASLLDFNQSHFDTIEIIDSTIDERSSANGGLLKTLRVENSKLDFALAGHTNVDTTIFRNSGNVVTGGGWSQRQISIKDCPKDTYAIDTGADGFDLLEIENCHVTSLTFFDSKGKTVIIKNASAYDMDFRDSNIENLILENVKIHRKVKYQDTTIGNIEQKNLSFSKDVKVWNENSNIEITPDSWLEE